MVNDVADPRAARLRAAVALAYAAVALTVIEYWFIPYVVEDRLPGPHAARPSLQAGVTWVAACVAVYLVFPLVLVLALHREGLRSIGFDWRGFVRHVPVYAGLYALAIPLVWLASRRPEFLDMYPFVADALASSSAFVRWETAYLVQFFALEAFFRGYLLFTLERAMGSLAVFVSMVPYAMIHWHKPPLEALAAIAGGLLMGALALRYRSFYGGFVVHGAVALTMDLVAASRLGLVS